MFDLFLEKNLLSPKQSGFRPGESCINPIPHELFYVLWFRERERGGRGEITPQVNTSSASSMKLKLCTDITLIKVPKSFFCFSFFADVSIFYHFLKFL